MPYVSDRQRRYMHWAASKGKISPKVVEEFDRATPKGAKLPEKAPEHGPQNEPRVPELMEKSAMKWDILSSAMADELSSIIKTAGMPKQSGWLSALVRKGEKKAVGEVVGEAAKKATTQAVKSRPMPMPPRGIPIRHQTAYPT